jgi:hypothetical protein
LGKEVGKSGAEFVDSRIVAPTQGQARGSWIHLRKWRATTTRSPLAIVFTDFLRTELMDESDSYSVLFLKVGIRSHRTVFLERPWMSIPNRSYH